MMSTIITASVNEGRQTMYINADDTNTVISDTDFENWVFVITGEPKIPFITGVRFINCKIVADNLRAFGYCYFDDDCNLVVGNLPHVGCTAINDNRVREESQYDN